jgi:beta/gamma crystallin
MGMCKWRSSVWMWLLLIASTVSLMGSSAWAQARRYGGGGGITVYADPNFSGKSATLRGDTPDLRAYGLNDKISSFDIPNGESWEVCQDINYGNRCQVFSSSMSDLRRLGWNDTISSLRPVRGFQGQRSERAGGVLSPNLTPQMVIYDRPGFRGTSRTVTAQTSNLGSIGSRGGSIEVLSGTWELCDRYRRCATVSQSVPDLSQLGLSGAITSVRPMNNQRNDRGYGQGGRNRYWGR